MAGIITVEVTDQAGLGGIGRLCVLVYFEVLIKVKKASSLSWDTNRDLSWKNVSLLLLLSSMSGILTVL